MHFLFAQEHVLYTYELYVVIRISLAPAQSFELCFQQMKKQKPWNPSKSVNKRSSPYSFICMKHASMWRRFKSRIFSKTEIRTISPKSYFTFKPITFKLLYFTELTKKFSWQQVEQRIYFLKIQFLFQFYFAPDVMISQFHLR